MFVGADIEVAVSRLPRLKPGEYYWSQLEGLKVINLAGQELGVVSYLFETGANDVLVVAGERERLIPYTHTVVRTWISTPARCGSTGTRASDAH